MKFIIDLIHSVYNALWGDLITIPLPGGGTLGIPLLVLMLIPTGIYFTIRTKFLPIRLFPEMLRVTMEKKAETTHNSISGFQALVVSTSSCPWASRRWTPSRTTNNFAKRKRTPRNSKMGLPKNTQRL